MDKKASSVNSAGVYTKPTMRKALFNKIKAGKQFVAQPKAIARKVAKYR